MEGQLWGIGLSTLVQTKKSMYDEFSDPAGASVIKFEQMLKTDKIQYFDAQEFETITQHYLDNGQNNMATRALKLGLEQHPNNIELLLVKSELFVFDSEFSEAESLLDLVDQLSPQNEEVFLQRANIHSKRKEHQEAIAMLNRALLLTEDPLDVWSLLGMEYLLVENYEAAAKYFKLCLKETPLDYQSLYNILYCFEHLEKPQEAIFILNEVLEEHPYCEVAWHQLGKIYTQTKRYEEALSAYEFALISDDTFTGAYVEKGKLLEQLGRLNEAIENYQIAMQTSDPGGYAYHRIGMCHLQLGNKQLGVNFLKESIHLEPHFEKSWMGLIDFFLKENNNEKALYYCKKGLQANEDSVQLWKKNGEIHYSMKHYSEADYAYENTVALGNYELESWIQWIDSLLHLQEWNKALKIGLQAREFYPETASIAIRVAGCYHTLGKKDESQYFNRAFSKDQSLVAQMAHFFPNLVVKS